MNFAGTETLLMNIYRNIDRTRIQFDFAVCSSEPGDYDEEILSMGGRIIHYPRYRVHNHVQYAAWWNAFFKSNEQYTIVHGHIGSTAAIYLGIAKKHGRFTIAHSHSISIDRSLKSTIYNIYSYPTRYIADIFFGCSEQAIVDRYGRKVAGDPDRAYVVKNAIDVDRFNFDKAVRKKIRQEYGLPDDELVLMTVGRLTPAKNPFETIRICESLKKSGLDFVFLWLGKGELEDSIRKEIKSRDLEDTVLLKGSRDDIYNVLQAADIFIFPSEWEGLGIACVEAQASGLPTLCSDTIPVEAKAAECCRFLPLNDTGRWCREIISIAGSVRDRAYERPDTRREITDAGYDIKGVAEWLCRFYENVNGSQKD